MDQQQVGKFIQERRKALGWTQQQLADKIGVTNKAVSKWELGRSMPDIALFEPLCETLEISLAELLAGKAIDEEDRQDATEKLLMESISTGNLVGLQIFLMINSIIGVLLALCPLLFPVEAPFSWLLPGIGLVECCMVLIFDYTLPGKEARRRSFPVIVIYSVFLFFTMAVISFPGAVREGVPLRTWILLFGGSCLLSILLNYLLTRKK